jgi:hypothetical protein
MSTLVSPSEVSPSKLHIRHLPRHIKTRDYVSGGISPHCSAEDDLYREQAQPYMRLGTRPTAGNSG